MTRAKRYTVAVDFDGVIHSYTSPWVDAETIPDPPVEGAIEWLEEISRKFDVVIFTTRGKTEAGRTAVAKYIALHGYCGEDFEVTAGPKPMALVYVDDRAWRFEGDNFPSPDEIHSAVPWTKRAATSQGPPE